MCPFLFLLEDASSPVPVSENNTEREGSLFMIGGELRADQVRKVSPIKFVEKEIKIGLHQPCMAVAHKAIC